MRIEDIEVIEKSLEGLKIKRKTLDNIRRFVESLVVNERIHISIDGQTLNNAYELFGDGILKVVQDKQLEIEKEIYNFNLTDLIPVDNSSIIKNHLDDIEPFYSKYDIYERVQLDSSDKAIRRIEGINLIPCVTYSYDDELNAGEIIGFLKFSIQYVSSDGNIAEYTRQIPVEINLGSRYIDYADIKYDIIDLKIEELGLRCINVTAKLIVSSK